MNFNCCCDKRTRNYGGCTWSCFILMQTIKLHFVVCTKIVNLHIRVNLMLTSELHCNWYGYIQYCCIVKKINDADWVSSFYIRILVESTGWNENLGETLDLYWHLYTHHHALTEELRLKDHNEFRRFLRMKVDTFDQLVELITPYVGKIDTNMRKAITVEERLSVTLRFLATGKSKFKFLSDN